MYKDNAYVFRDSTEYKEHALPARLEQSTIKERKFAPQFVDKMPFS